jgi:hypothetical protein
MTFSIQTNSSLIPANHQTEHNKTKMGMVMHHHIVLNESMPLVIIERMPHNIQIDKTKL